MARSRRRYRRLGSDMQDVAKSNGSLSIPATVILGQLRRLRRDSDAAQRRCLIGSLSADARFRKDFRNLGVGGHPTPFTAARSVITSI